jgi:hypothetical protein
MSDIQSLRSEILSKLGLDSEISKEYEPSEKENSWKVIRDNLENLREIGDQCEEQQKNEENAMCSIYYFNDLNHLIDYRSNGHHKSDREKFKRCWNNILNSVKTLSDKDRKFVIGMEMDKNSLFFFQHEMKEVDSYIQLAN